MNSTQTLEEFLTDTANEFPKLKTLRSRLLEIGNMVVQDTDEQDALKYFKGKKHQDSGKRYSNNKNHTTQSAFQLL